jgi:sugar lactone lactonase YvrE
MTDFTALPVAPSLLGESPLWHPDEQVLYWVDIPGRQVRRFDPASGGHNAWPVDSEPACIAPLLGGGLLLAARDGLWRFDTATGARARLAAPPYDPAGQRFNDGKADAQGRFWVGTIDDRREPRAALYCLAGGELRRMADGIAASNGLAFTPDGRMLLWADTKGHCVIAFDLDPADGSLSRRRVVRQFPLRDAHAPLQGYGGRPDGAAMDSEGAYWVAMFEGQRLLRLSPAGDLLAELALPVRCPTMPCFGGRDLRTLYVTTARDKRPADELAAQPLAGCVLQCRVDVPGLPAHVAHLAGP